MGSLNQGTFYTTEFRGKFMSFRSYQRGVSLIEVLVAIVVFSVGVLGIALMQIKGAQYTKQSGSRTAAVVQARSIADAMRANPAGVYGVADASPTTIATVGGSLAGSYYAYSGTTAPDPTTCGNTPCKQAKQDLLVWLAQLKASTAAPTSTGSTTTVLAKITPNSNTGTLTVVSSWNGLIQDTNGATINDQYQFDYQP
jgi:type IV pilus assembly protein PilV